MVSFSKKLVRIGVLAMGLAMPLSAQEKWTSPHEMVLEEKAPAALLPFPKEVAWRGVAPLPGRGQWELVVPRAWEGMSDGRMMVETAWKGVLADLPEKGEGRMVCRLVEDAKAADGEAEGYEMEVKPGEVIIRAATETGMFYGLQTLRQLVASGKKLPLCSIRDWPAFALRGFHIDCGRNFQTIESLKRQIDLAARLKVNCFHWHLTDDPAFRVQSKVFPELNDPKHRERDANDTYSYDRIRELIAYARARGVRIIPELDMPGHSRYFNKAFGFPMASEKGIAALEKIIGEFCAEIPAVDCPIIHFGADETHVSPELRFVERICEKLRSLGRDPMQWCGPRDLAVHEGSIGQNWGDGMRTVDISLPERYIIGRTVDSCIGYANLYDPALLVRRWFFMRPCGGAKGDEKRLGPIICIWPDTRVADKSLIPLHSAQWPGICAMAERAWEGGAGDGDALPVDMPAPDTEAAKAFSLFEKRIETLRRTMFRDEHFPYWTESGQEWTVVGPVPEAQKEQVRDKVLAGKPDAPGARKTYGGSLYFRTKPNIGYIGMFSSTKPGNVVWAVTTIRAAKAGDAPFMIGFDSPARSSRRWSGVPAAGEWSQCGTRIWLNGREIKNPQVYKTAGKNRCTGDTWGYPRNEEPFTNEDIWWAHEPTLLPLRKGENTIIIEQPYIGEFQTWAVSCIPLFRQPSARAKTKKNHK